MFSSIIKNVYDLHVHVWPEVLPRKYSVKTLAKQESWKIKWIWVKNHMFPTVFAYDDSFPLQVIYSVTLNQYVWGINKYTVKASSELIGKPIIVRFPTINSRLHLQKHTYEIPPEWVWNKQFVPTLSSEVNPVKILDKSWSLSEETKGVVDTIKKYDNILATWHLNVEESKKLITYARKVWARKIIITHPIYHIQNYSIQDQIRFTQQWAMIELPAAMDYLDKIPIDKMIEQINIIWYENYILSSDCWQIFSWLPSEVLNIFCERLYKWWLEKNIIIRMLMNSIWLVENI